MVSESLASPRSCRCGSGLSSVSGGARCSSSRRSLSRSRMAWIQKTIWRPSTAVGLLSRVMLGLDELDAPDDVFPVGCVDGE